MYLSSSRPSPPRSDVTTTEAWWRKKSSKLGDPPLPVSCMKSRRPSAHSRQSSSATTEAPRRELKRAAASPKKAPGPADATRKEEGVEGVTIKLEIVSDLPRSPPSLPTPVRVFFSSIGLRGLASARGLAFSRTIRACPLSST
jgi:hypothetical protein